MNIITIIGSRPQMTKQDKELPQRIIYTGQHYDINMKDVFFKDLKLPKPDWDLNETKLPKMISGIWKILKKEKPQCVQVFGDCRSTLAGAIAAQDLNIPIVHVEAGMRCFRTDVPEERIRRMVDHASTVLFVPNLDAIVNLENEHIREGVYKIGNVMFDTFASLCPLKKGKDYKKYVYLSIHRQENTESKINLESIFEAITGKEKIIFPVHPRTRNAIKDFGIKIPKNVKMIEPASYKKNIQLISDAKKVLTDSGGVQNESYWMSVPCGVLRRQTEWMEQVKDGWSFLLGADKTSIEKFLTNSFKVDRKRTAMPTFGAKKRIRQILNEIYG